MKGLDAYFSRMQTVIVTGSNGLLGQKLLDKLRDRRALRLVACARGENRYPHKDGYIYERVDLTDFDALSQLFDKYEPDVLINCAAMTQVDACEQDTEQCEAVNVKAVHSIAGLCKQHDTQLIHLSTDFIFDGEDGPYAEDATPAPLSVYGHSKLKAEKIIEKSGARAAIVRTVLVFGVVADMSRSNIVLWAKGSLEQGKPIAVVDDQFRSPTLAEDLADGVIAIMFRGKTGVYHISGPEIMSVYDIAVRVADHFKLDRSLISRTDSASLGQAAKRPPKTGFIILKAQTELDYNPCDFESALQIVAKQINAAKS